MHPASIAAVPSFRTFPGSRAMRLAGWQGIVINAIIRAGNWKNRSGTASGIILALIGVLLTVGAVYCGWTMSLYDNVGVAPTPEQERLEHGVRVT